MRPTKTTTTRDPLQRTASSILRYGARARSIIAVRNLDNARRIANFLRGRMEFGVRPTDVFISSYPRSGTTLTQWILYLLTHDEQPDPSASHERVALVRAFAGHRRAHRHRLWSAFRRRGCSRVTSRREWLPDGARYIYVERDGLDVLLSYFHFYRDVPRL